MMFNSYVFMREIVMKVFRYKRKLPEEANQSMAQKFTTNKRNQGKRRRVIAQTFYSLILFLHIACANCNFLFRAQSSVRKQFFFLDVVYTARRRFVHSLEKMLLIMRENCKEIYRSLKLYYFAFRSGCAFCLPYSHYTKNSFLHIIVSAPKLRISL